MVNACDGVLVGDVLRPVERVDDYGQLVAVELPQHRIDFWDGTSLDFHQWISPEGEVEEYGYNLRWQDDRAPIAGVGICRVDKHTGHERDVGLTHVHIGPNEADAVMRAAQEYNLREALKFARKYLPK